MTTWIGIPQTLDARERIRRGRRYHYLDAAYAEAVREAGGVPLYLPIQEDVEALVARVDGLLLPGGDDFEPPSPYPADVSFEPAAPEQVDFDRALLAAGLARGTPLLAICYGMQLLALHCGGSLLYDVAHDAPGAREHRLPEHERHPLAVEPGSRLAGLVGASPGPVNSLHHQGVADAGALRVAARADDGLIEAVEREGDGFCLGVQWHPEKLDGPHRHALFAGFVKACE